MTDCALQHAHKFKMSKTSELKKIKPIKLISRRVYEKSYLLGTHKIDARRMQVLKVCMLGNPHKRNIETVDCLACIPNFFHHSGIEQQPLSHGEAVLPLGTCFLESLCFENPTISHLFCMIEHQHKLFFLAGEALSRVHQGCFVSMIDLTSTVLRVPNAVIWKKKENINFLGSKSRSKFYSLHGSYSVAPKKGIFWKEPQLTEPCELFHVLQLSSSSYVYIPVVAFSGIYRSSGTILIGYVPNVWFKASGVCPLKRLGDDALM